MNFFGWSVPVTLALSILSVACGDDGDGTGGTGGGGGSGGGGNAEPICTEPTAVACEDDVVLKMNLQADVSEREVTNTAKGTGFVSSIDATAGGAFVADPESYVYARFTDEGMTRVDLSDEDALASMDWDIAFRRYVVRINSGSSGPSCVQAARLAGTDFEGTTEVPDSAKYRVDTYFTESCELIPDGTGLDGSPATALSSFWTYPGCVQMTGNVFVIQLADARRLKFRVNRFYNETAQTQCQEDETIPMTNNGSANFEVEWAFL